MKLKISIATHWATTTVSKVDYKKQVRLIREQLARDKGKVFDRIRNWTQNNNVPLSTDDETEVRKVLVVCLSKSSRFERRLRGVVLQPSSITSWFGFPSRKLKSFGILRKDLHRLDFRA